MNSVEGNSQSLKRLTHLMGAAMALSLFGDLALFASLPTNTSAAGVAVGSLGLVFGIHRLIRIPGNTLGGRLIHRAPRRPFFLLGMVLALLSTLGYAMAQGLAWLLVSRVVWGTAWILIYISGMTMMVDATTPENRGKWMGLYNTWYLIGIAGGSLSGGLIADLIGFRNAMLVCAAFTLLGLLMAVFGVPETQKAQVDDSIRAHTKTDDKVSLLPLLKASPGLLVILLIYLVNQFAGEGVALSMLSLLLKERLGNAFTLGRWMVGAASLSGILLAMRYLLSAFLSPVIGAVSDRIDPGRIKVIIAGLLIAAVSMVVIAYGHSLGWLLGGMLLNALSGSTLMVALAAYLGDHSTPATQSRLIGLYATFGDTGSALGPMFGYWLLTFGSISRVFVVCAVLFGACIVLLGSVRIWQTSALKFQP